MISAFNTSNGGGIFAILFQKKTLIVDIITKKIIARSNLSIFAFFKKLINLLNLELLVLYLLEKKLLIINMYAHLFEKFYYLFGRLY